MDAADAEHSTQMAGVSSNKKPDQCINACNASMADQLTNSQAIHEPDHDPAKASG